MATLRDRVEKKTKLALQGMMVKKDPVEEEVQIRMRPAILTILLLAAAAAAGIVVLFVLLSPPPRYTYHTVQYGASGAVLVPGPGDTEVTPYGTDGVQIFTLFGRVQVYFRGPPVLKTEDEWLAELQALRCTVPDPGFVRGIVSTYRNLGGVVESFGGAPLLCLPPNLNVSQRSKAQLYAVIPSAVPWFAVESLARRVADWLTANSRADSDMLQLVGVQSMLAKDWSSVTLVFGWPAERLRPLVSLFYEVPFGNSTPFAHNGLVGIYDVPAARRIAYSGCCADARLSQNNFVYGPQLRADPSGGPGCEEFVGCQAFIQNGSAQCGEPWALASCPATCGTCPGAGVGAWYKGNVSILSSKGAFDLMRAHVTTTWLATVYQPLATTPLADVLESLFLISNDTWPQEVKYSKSLYDFDPLFTFSMRDTVATTVTERCQYVLANAEILIQILMSAMVMQTLYWLIERSPCGGAALAKAPAAPQAPVQVERAADPQPHAV